ncbi:hypothetical protein C8R43DRAFT_844453, partial [Mycena crocata]
MADITQDPNLQVCPDFASAGFAAIRSNIIGTGTLTNAEVAEQLRAAWKTSNDAEKVLWDQQVQRERDAAAVTRQAREEEAERVRLGAEKEAEAERKEAEKKKPKLADFDEEKGVADRIAIRPSPFAVKKLDEFSYIELYYL